jgi:eukaryotic-like serine/threonine-protein kinase
MEAAWGLHPGDEASVLLRALQATAAFWSDDFATLHAVGNEVLPRLKPGSARWSQLISWMCVSHGLSGQATPLLELHRQLLDAGPEFEARGAYHQALGFMGCMALYVGALSQADAVFERLERDGREFIAGNPIVRGWRALAYCFRTLCVTEGPWQALRWAEEAHQAFREAGSERDLVTALSSEGQARMALGDTEGGLARAREAMGVALRVGQPYGITYARQQLMLMLVGSPDPEHQREARALALGWAETENPNRVHLGSALLVLGWQAAFGGALAEAESLAHRACETLAPVTAFAPLARWLLGGVVLAQGRAAEARQIAEEALRELERAGGGGSAKVGLLQVLADTCFILGDTSAGEETLRHAVRCVRSRAEAIPDPAIRDRFLSQVPENVRVLELARQRWGQGE